VYLPHLSRTPHVELVSACDIIPKRAEAQARKFKIPHQYPHIDKLVGGQRSTCSSTLWCVAAGL
jgi:predicted dehydrogenase